MNRDDIIRMARDAGFDIHHEMIWVSGWEIGPYMQRFAHLVAAAEREACAVMAEAFHHHQYDFTGDLELHEAIRARGEK